MRRSGPRAIRTDIDRFRGPLKACRLTAVAQTRKKRRRKHRGTQAGTIERSGRTGRPRTREEAKKISRERRTQRFERPPTMKGAAQRAAIAAAIFGVVIVVAFGRNPAQGAFIALFMFLIYIPLGFATDKAIYNFRQRRKASARSK
jgi:Flp pilus assembly protein TadB